MHPLLLTKRGRFAGTLIGLTIAGMATAQTPPNAGSLLQQIERERQPVLPGRVVPEKPATPEPLKALSGPTVTVKTFRFVGNTLVGEQQLAAALSGYVGQTLDFRQLQIVVGKVTRIYREAGWIVRAYLPQQDIQDGVVTIQIVEAVFGGTRLEGAPAKRMSFEQIERIVSAQQKTGELLYADAIDRALLLAGDLPGVNATGGLRGGAKSGETDLVIRMSDGPAATSDVTVDNTGSRATGPLRLAINATANSLAGLGDALAGTAVHTQGSDYLRLGATLPVGGDGWRIGANTSAMNYQVVTAEFAGLNVKGTSGTLGLEASYPVIRSKLKNLYFNAAFDRKNFDNQSAGAVISHYDTQALTLGLSGNLFDNLFGGGNNSASLSLVNGNVNLNGSPNQAADALTAHAAGNYTKLRYNASRQQVLTPELAIYLAASGQRTNDNLVACND